MRRSRTSFWVLLLATALVTGCGEDTGLHDVDGDQDGYSVAAGDCNDADPTVHPGAADLPNDGIDQDCDGKDAIDAAGLDGDGDGQTPADGDCDDGNKRVFAGAVDRCGDGVDQDCDGKDLPCSAVDGDGDGTTPAQGDCDDEDPAVHPGATEVVYNGKDDDCDPQTPDDDLDGDGFGKLLGNDCDDNDKTRFPGADEIPYDGIDQDCDGADLLDADGDGVAATSAGGGDCDDQNPYVRPGGVEVCGDGIDQDCKGGDQPCTNVDLDGDGYSPLTGDCDDTDKGVSPAAQELPYNGKDDDCDPKTKDDDLDGDGFAALGGGDCDDSKASVFPGAKEIPYDGVDQDCSGADLVDLDGDGQASPLVAGGTDCDDNDPKVYLGAPEIPFDNVDSNCDGDDLPTFGDKVVHQTSGYPNYFGVATSSTSALLVWSSYSSAGDTLESLRTNSVASVTGAVVTLRQALSGWQIQSVTVATSGGGEWLVVWVERKSNDYTIRAQRVGAGGAPTGGLVTIRATSSTYPYISRGLVSDGAGWLLVWRDRPSGQRYRVRAQRLKSDGSADGAELTLSDTSKDAYDPILAKGSKGWLVLWRQDKGSGYGLYGKLLAGSTVGSELTVLPPPASISGPRLASDGGAFLLVNRSGYQLDAQRLDADGKLVGSSVKAAVHWSSPYARGLVYCGGGYELLLSDYRYHQDIDNLRHRPISATGTVSGGSSTLLFQGSDYLNDADVVCLGAKPWVFWADDGQRLRAMEVK